MTRDAVRDETRALGIFERGCIEGREKQCRVCHWGFGASVRKYKCTDCAHYLCSPHCKVE